MKMNKLGSAGKPGSGSLFTPDPVAQSAALEEAHHKGEHEQLAMLRKYQAGIAGNGHSNGHAEGNGHSNGHSNGHASEGNGHQDASIGSGRQDSDSDR